jgi:hypothetical protein
VAPLAVLMLHVAVAPMLDVAYNPHVMGRILAAHEAQGLATTDDSYHGQFTFAGALQSSVAVLPEAAAQAEWIASHPGGLIYSQIDLVDLPLEVIGAEVFHGKHYQIYRVTEAPQ